MENELEYLQIGDLNTVRNLKIMEHLRARLESISKRKFRPGHKILTCAPLYRRNMIEAIHEDSKCLVENEEIA